MSIPILQSGQGGALLLPSERARLDQSGLLANTWVDQSGLRFSRTPSFAAADSSSTVLLWEQELAAHGSLRPPHNQGTQDCLSHAWAKAFEDYLITANGTDSRVISTEVLYGGSRVQIGHTGPAQPGSCCAWVAEFLIRYGSLPRDQYGVWNLINYNLSLAEQFGQDGVPSELFPKMAKADHMQVGRLRRGEDAWMAAGHNHPLPFATTKGFEETRGPGGVCSPQGTWNHSMVVRGRGVLKDGRKVFAVQNSIGDYLGETNRIVSFQDREEAVTLPAGVFLIDLAVLSDVCQNEDCYVIF